MTLEQDFEVEHYLAHQGESFVERFDALTYLNLERTDGLLRPDRRSGLDLRAAADAGPAFWRSRSTADWRFSSEHSARLAQELVDGGLDAEHVEIKSPWGHDSFLLDVPEYHRRLAWFCWRPHSGDRARELAPLAGGAANIARFRARRKIICGFTAPGRACRHRLAIKYPQYSQGEPAAPATPSHSSIPTTNSPTNP